MNANNEINNVKVKLQEALAKANINSAIEVNMSESGYFDPSLFLYSGISIYISFINDKIEYMVGAETIIYGGRDTPPEPDIFEFLVTDNLDDAVNRMVEEHINWLAREDEYYDPTE